jgi:hypothetical protein
MFSHLLKNGNNVKYTIQSLTLEGFEEMIIPLGIKADPQKKLHLRQQPLTHQMV